jgi:hypothetical protein
MLSNTSNLFIDEQQIATAIAKRKEDDVTIVTQATAATAHWEQEAIITSMDVARKTLDEARVCELAVGLTWEEKTTVHHPEQQLTTAQGIAIPQYDDDDRSDDAGSNPDATLIVHLPAQAVGLQNIQAVAWPRALTLRRYALDDHVISDIADPFIYWARLDNIMVTRILDTLSPELHEIIWEPTETACQAWRAIETQFLGNHESRVLQLDTKFRVFKQGDLSVSDYCR